MWMLIALGILNSFLSFIANYVLRFSAFDITPAAMIILAQRGEGILVPAIVMLGAYALVSPKELGYIWVTFPLAILTGFLATWIPSPIILLLIYHVLGAVPAFFFSYLDVKYAGFAFINFTLNYGLAKIIFLFA